MRVLIYTSSSGTAHDAAAEAIAEWLKILAPKAEVTIDSVVENASSVGRAGTDLYNWIQRQAPWLHQIYWRLLEFEDHAKPGTVIYGHNYLVRTLKSQRPDLLISTHPHINRGHFDLAKRVVGPQLRCVTCCTELDGGFGFTRNWVSPKADSFWAITEEVAQEVRSRGYPSERIAVLGPLLHPPFHDAQQPTAQQPSSEPSSAGQTVTHALETDSTALPLLVLGSGSNGANNHQALLNALLPFAGRLRVVALCGKRAGVVEQLEDWARAHPGLTLRALGFQDPAEMVELYRGAWAMVARPGARTATEALALGCPLIFNRHGVLMPQELLALRYFQARDLERSIRKPCDLADHVGRLLDEPHAYQAWRERYLQARLSANPLAVVRFLLSHAPMQA